MRFYLTVSSEAARPLLTGLLSWSDPRCPLIPRFVGILGTPGFPSQLQILIHMIHPSFSVGNWVDDISVPALHIEGNAPLHEIHFQGSRILTKTLSMSSPVHPPLHSINIYGPLSWAELTLSSWPWQIPLRTDRCLAKQTIFPST